MIRRCVLLADRHPSMLAAVHGLLQAKFATTVMVADEASLLETVTQLEPDLVVVDQSLPASRGVDVVCTLMARHPGLRVIVLSVYDEILMSTLVVVSYDEPFKAEEVHLKLIKMQKAYLIDVEDAAFAVKDAKGRFKVHQTYNLTAAGAIRGGFSGHSSA
jgi:CheY-like chemotaxis protein